jgi:hypothetical protein
MCLVILNMLMLRGWGVMGSGSSERVVNVEIDLCRVQSLAHDILELLSRKGGRKVSRGEVVSEYWALRLAALIFKDAVGFTFDNEEEVVSAFKLEFAKVGCDRVGEG